MLAQGKTPFDALDACSGQASHGLLASVMFELVDDDGADDDAAFDDLLPVSGNVGQVEDVVQYTDNESTDDSTCYGADSAGG